MNAPSNDEEDQGEVFLDESDIIQEITVDEEGSDSLFPHTFSCIFISLEVSLCICIYEINILT